MSFKLTRSVCDLNVTSTVVAVLILLLYNACVETVTELTRTFQVDLLNSYLMKDRFRY